MIKIDTSNSCEKIRQKDIEKINNVDTNIAATLSEEPRFTMAQGFYKKARDD